MQQLIWSWSMAGHSRLQPLPNWIEKITAAFVFSFVFFILINLKPASFNLLEYLLLLFVIALVVVGWLRFEEKRNRKSKRYHSGKVSISDGGISYDLIEEFKNGRFYPLASLELPSLKVERRWCICNEQKRKFYAIVFRTFNGGREIILPIPHIESDGDSLKKLNLALDQLRSTKS